MRESVKSKQSQSNGFTILELLVAVSVTAILATLLLNITSQVVSTQTKASGDLETNQVAQFVLDRIQEDLHCAFARNDGNVWMAATIQSQIMDGSDWKKVENLANGKPVEQSLRIKAQDWPESMQNEKIIAEGQGALGESRFGKAGTWFRFFTQSPELDSTIQNMGGIRAVGYQIVRFGLTGSNTSRPRYQLFRSDVNPKETFNAGFNLHPQLGNYNSGTSNLSRMAGNIMNPIYQTAEGESPTGFSLANNVIDFGIRAYLIDRNSKGTGNLRQIFPNIEDTTEDYEFLASTHQSYMKDPSQPHLNAFPEVVDVMIRILTTEGESAISAFEAGLTPVPSNYDNAEEYWWDLAEKNSDVYIRRIKIFSSAI